MTTEYEKAKAEYDEAFAIFNPVYIAYTDINIPLCDRPTHEQFFAAKKLRDEATAEFDAAFATAAGY